MEERNYPILYYDYNAMPAEEAQKIVDMLVEKYPNIILLPKSLELLYATKDELETLIEYELRIMASLKEMYETPTEEEPANQGEPMNN